MKFKLVELTVLDIIELPTYVSLLLAIQDTVELVIYKVEVLAVRLLPIFNAFETVSLTVLTFVVLIVMALMLDVLTLVVLILVVLILEAFMLVV